MKKVLFGIFAHPDDEAFGPSAFLYHQAQNGVAVHLVTATNGEAGTNTDNVPNLGEVRLREWEESRKRIGAVSGLALHYPDGGLCNDLYLEVAEKIIDYITTTCAAYGEPTTVDILTFDHDGVSGHLDHIAMSFITTYVYLTLKKHLPKNVSVGTLRYYCLPEVAISHPNTHWIYMAKGKNPSEVDEVFDFRALTKEKQHIMNAHYSQRKDMEEVILVQQNQAPSACRCDHFRYYK